jgi:hypothetical protein
MEMLEVQISLLATTFGTGKSMTILAPANRFKKRIGIKPNIEKAVLRIMHKSLRLEKTAQAKAK